MPADLRRLDGLIDLLVEALLQELEKEAAGSICHKEQTGAPLKHQCEDLRAAECTGCN